MNKDTKLIYEAFKGHTLNREETGDERWDRMRKEDPEKEQEYKNKLLTPGHKALKNKAQSDYDKTKTATTRPEYSSKEKERLAGFQTEEDESSVEDIQASRYGGDGNEFDANADLKQEVSDINDLVDAFYSAGEVDPGKHDEVARAIHAAKKALEGVVGINVDFDMHGKAEGPDIDDLRGGEDASMDPDYNQYT